MGAVARYRQIELVKNYQDGKGVRIVPALRGVKV